MMRTGREQTAATVSHALATREEIHIAILYGSILEDRFGDHSDVDLAVAGGCELSYDELLTVSDELGKVTGREVQVRDLRRLEGLILREVLTQGSVIKNDDPDLLGRRIADMLDFVEDWLPTLRTIQ
ncbi:MAG: nucleotidyltransferase domain-containing protein, partial [Spirochaetales bacterium]|nr:nucleotidyltransferase domain-containing protein [Spirochaetales bacterium]